MALATWAVESGQVPIDSSGVSEVVIDVPSGRVTARVHTSGERVTRVDFVNIASFVTDCEVELQTSFGHTVVDIAFGGALYAHLDAGSLGLDVAAQNLRPLTQVGQEIRALVNERRLALHPADPTIDELYGVVIYQRIGQDGDNNVVHRNVLVYGDGQIDRSPCGTGTSSRMAVLHAAGELVPGQKFIHRSHHRIYFYRHDRFDC